MWQSQMTDVEDDQTAVIRPMNNYLPFIRLDSGDGD